VLKAKSSIDSLILKRTGKVDVTHFVDDVNQKNTSSSVNSLFDDHVSQRGGPALSTVGFNKNACPVSFLNLSDLPSTSSATRPDVMCSRDTLEQDQPPFPSAEKKIIRSRFFPDLMLDLTVNRKENSSSSSPTGFITKAQGMPNCNLWLSFKCVKQPLLLRFFAIKGCVSTNLQQIGKNHKNGHTN